ncbi:hypothetical protein RF11_13588 [Thelohanellus kitauei]|uniref:Uncharacterized protein n=1 Tax=Thelohanellus kitauei TaxID=669202 RepID=A0A0C2J5E1_THEKT|nr:hypothetical protein RF11_13588 [Thelohanellus kitauei]
MKRLTQEHINKFEWDNSTLNIEMKIPNDFFWTNILCKSLDSENETEISKCVMSYEAAPNNLRHNHYFLSKITFKKTVKYEFRNFEINFGSMLRGSVLVSFNIIELDIRFRRYTKKCEALFEEKEQIYLLFHGDDHQVPCETKFGQYIDEIDNVIYLDEVMH